MITQMIQSAGLRPSLSVAYWRSWREVRQLGTRTNHVSCYGGSTHNLTNELACRLNATPRRDILGVYDRRPRVRELLDESRVRDDAAIEVDFYSARY